MSFGEAFGYLAVGNPISQALINTVAVVAKKSGVVPKPLHSKEIAVPIAADMRSLSEIAGNHYIFIRLAGVSGAAAVILSAYGKHTLAGIEDAKDQMEAKAVFDTASRYHFLHTFALMAIPLARNPLLTGTLMATGTTLFSGTMYYRALTGDKAFVRVATFGGFCLIAAWLSLII